MQLSHQTTEPTPTPQVVLGVTLQSLGFTRDGDQYALRVPAGVVTVETRANPLTYVTRFKHSTEGTEATAFFEADCPDQVLGFFALICFYMEKRDATSANDGAIRQN